MPDVEFGAWGPDRQETGFEGMITATNVIPVLDGYATFRDFRTLGRGSLDDVCRGSASGTTQNGTNFIVGGTSTKLFLATSGDLTDETRLSGAYGLPSGGRWEFEVYGNLILATNGVDPIQYYDVTGSAEFDILSANAPLAKSIAVVGEFVVAGNIIAQGSSGASGGGPVLDGENSIQWSAIGDPKAWPQPGGATAISQQSDWQLLPNDGGRISKISSGSSYGMVLRDRESWRMDYIGGATAFSFTKIEDDRGCVAMGGAVALGGIVYYPSEEGFRANNGQTSVAIGNEMVDRTWWEDINKSDIDSVSVAHMAYYKSIIWYFPSDSVGFIYCYATGTWSKLAKSLEWVLSVLPLPTSLDSPPYAAMNMDTGSIATENMDELIQADAIRLGAFSTMHELGDFQSTAYLLGILDTGDYEPIPGRRAMVRRIRPVYQGSGIVVGVVAPKLGPNVDPALVSQKAPNSTGWIAQRACGAYMRARFLTSGEVTHFKGFDVRLEDAGGR